MSTSYCLRTWSCTMRLVVADPRVLDPAAADLRAMLDAVEAAASRFRPDSELSLANARAGRPTPVSRMLADLVRAALDAARVTDGLVDPAVGHVVRDLGYDADITALPADGPAVTAMPARSGWQAVRLNRELGLLTVPAGTALDLGATAKAYTADRAARVLSRRYGTAVLVELGGDVAFGGNRHPGWLLDVAEHAGGDGQQVVVTHGGLATSTTTIRRWRRGGAALHHIVDPRTGAPATGPWRTVTVHAASALAANTASTAAIVRGADAPQWLAARGLAARLVATDGTVALVGGWPAPALAKVA
jgi:thiamine biosynthesis lipoprotein